MTSKFTLFAISLILAGCSASGVGGPASGARSSAFTDTQRFDSLVSDYESKRQTLENYVDGCHSCDAAYPKVKSQILDLRQFIAALKAIKEFQPSDKFFQNWYESKKRDYPSNVAAYQERADRLEASIPLIESMIKSSTAKVAELEERKKQAGLQLEKLGCQTDGNGYISCPGETKTADDVRLHFKQQEAYAALKVVLLDERKFYEGFPRPGIEKEKEVDTRISHARSSGFESSQRCEDDVLKIIQATEGSFQTDVKIDTLDFFIDLRNALPSTCTPVTFAALDSELSKYKKFMANFVNLQSLLKTRAFDSITLGKDFKRYVDENYDHYPNTKESLNIVLPLNVDEEALTVFVQHLDLVNGPNWQKRASLIRQIDMELALFPKVTGGDPISLTVTVSPDLDRKAQTLSRFLDLLQNGPRKWKSWLELMQVGQKYPGGKVPKLEVTTEIGRKIDTRSGSKWCESIFEGKVIIGSSDFTICAMDVIQQNAKLAK